jgi:GrpB-like predicted nucleotidyltransferase (UPF0157 family)
MPDKVVIVPYDPEWPQLFSELGAALRKALGSIALRIDHIGSTSVPGLEAKPIVDVQISVASFEPLDAFRIPLERIGLVYRANNPDLSKRYFRESPGTRRTHVHVRCAGSFSEQLALLFRDYMRAHAGDARRYGKVKRQAAEEHGHDRRAYNDAKADFIWEMVAKADRWSQQTGWEPGPSDA